MNIADAFVRIFLDDGTVQVEAKKSGEKAGTSFGTSMTANIKKSWSGQELGKGLVQGLGFAGALGAANLVTGGIRKMTDFIGESINAASDLSESISKVGVVFGDSSKDVLDWSKTAAKAMGLSQQAALEASGTIGNLLLSMGKAPAEAAHMSKSLVQLAADLASFNNVDIEEVLTAIRSGLTGEIAPLRRFGVNLTDATLKAKAMELGLSDGKEVLDVSAKSAAAYALILEQTTTAQGDYARTADGVANSQRSLNAEIEDAKAQLGEKLLPIEKQWLQLQRDAIPLLGVTLGLVQNIGTGFETLASQADQYLNPFGHLVTRTAGHLDRAAMSAADFGTSLKDVADKGDRSATKMVTDAGRIASAYKRLARDMLADAQRIVDDYFDVIITKDNLAATNAEISAQKRILASSKATAAEKADARVALHQLERDQSQYLRDLAEHGATGSAVFTTAMAGLLKRLKTAHGAERTAILAEIRAIDLLALKAKIASGVMLTLQERITATIAKGGYVSAAGAGTGGHPKPPGEGARAGGGPVNAGQAYWVGEQGPELVVPRLSAMVVPHAPSMALAAAGSAAGGDTFNVNLLDRMEARSVRDIGSGLRMLGEQGHLVRKVKR